MDILNSSSVKIKNHAQVTDKINQLVSDGPSKLQVISDFDYTLTRSHLNGTACWSTHQIFNHDPAMGSLATKLESLKEKYYPIEFDPRLTSEEKTPHMVTWWTTAHDTIVEAGISKHSLERMMEHAEIHLRDGAADLLNLLKSNQIPIVVFSAGIADLISIFMKQRLKEPIPPNMHIMSNRMVYDDTEAKKIIGFKDPLVHTFNKNSSVIDKEERGLLGYLADRPNVLLLGDSMGDIHMDVGVLKESVVLRIGFLNKWVDQLLPKYMDAYDIVCVYDQSMEVPTQIVNEVLGKKPE